MPLPEETWIRRQADPDANFGVFDVVDEVWIGDSQGAVYYERELIARIAASMFAVQMGVSRTRLIALANTRGPLRHKDGIPIQCDGKRLSAGSKKGQWSDEYGLQCRTSPATGCIGGDRGSGEEWLQTLSCSVLYQ